MNGYFIMMLIQQAGSHGVLYWDVESIDPHAKFANGESVYEFMHDTCSDTRTRHRILETNEHTII